MTTVTRAARLWPLLLALALLAAGPAWAGFSPKNNAEAVEIVFGNIVPKANDWGKSAGNLSKPDQGMDPDYNPPGSPEAPTGCAKSDACRECYLKAQQGISKLRYNFAELLTLYKQTDALVKDSYSFGDAIAGMAGYGALAWHHERARIAKSFSSFEAAYRKKYNELLKKLEDALKELGQCEAQHFGDQDWYNRYGFMFLSFVAMHYQR